MPPHRHPPGRTRCNTTRYSCFRPHSQYSQQSKTSRSLFTRRPMGRDADLFARYAGTSRGRSASTCVAPVRALLCCTWLDLVAGKRPAARARERLQRYQQQDPRVALPIQGTSKIIAFMDFGGDQVAAVHAGLPRLELGLRQAANGFLPWLLSAGRTQAARRGQPASSRRHPHAVLHNFREPEMSAASLVPVGSLANPLGDQRSRTSMIDFVASRDRSGLRRKSDTAVSSGAESG